MQPQAKVRHYLTSSNLTHVRLETQQRVWENLLHRDTTLSTAELADAKTAWSICQALMLCMVDDTVSTEHKT